MPISKIVEIARPAGVVFALTPSTNPVATVFYKSMLCLLTRNAVIISPHPMAKACCADAAKLLAKAAEEAGAPDGVIQVIEEPSLPIVETVMKSDRIDVILATGGTPVVRAAYSSGNPALSASGPAMCRPMSTRRPMCARAARRSPSPSPSTTAYLCTNEIAIIAHGAIAAALEQELKRNGCHILRPMTERDQLEHALFPGRQVRCRAHRQVGRGHRRQSGLRVAAAHEGAGGAARAHWRRLSA